MRVLHVIPSVGPVRGGPSSAIRTMARSLAQAGLAVEVATTDDNGPDRLRVVYDRAGEDDGVIFRYFRRQTRFYTFSWSLTRWLDAHVRDFDLLHIHALFSYAAVPAAYCAQRDGIPYVVRPLGVLNRWGMRNRRAWLKKLSLAMIERHILAGAAAVHYASEEERLQAAALMRDQTAVVIPNAVEVPSDCDRQPGRFRARFPSLGKRPLVLFLSRFEPIKGLDLLLPAFAQARKKIPGAMLVLAGAGAPKFTARLRQDAERLGIAADICWPGFLTGEEKWAVLADADLFVLPSYSENFGVAVVEAMACGRPVVVSDRVPVHREISETKAGLVVSCNVDSVARALIAGLSDAPSRFHMGMNAKQLAESRFSTVAVTAELIRLYDSVTEMKPAAWTQRPGAVNPVHSW